MAGGGDAKKQPADRGKDSPLPTPLRKGSPAAGEAASVFDMLEQHTCERHRPQAGNNPQAERIAEGWMPAAGWCRLKTGWMPAEGPETTSGGCAAVLPDGERR